MQVIKLRDGRTEPFNGQKIDFAISKAGFVPQELREK